MRLWSDTEAVKQRQKAEEEYVQLQKPLYQINSFTSKQVRVVVKFENRSLVMSKLLQLNSIQLLCSLNVTCF